MKGRGRAAVFPAETGLGPWLSRVAQGGRTEAPRQAPGSASAARDWR